ncbi:hypothetical protein OTB20_08540 [Streptomyces sp. H27-H1]|uniref:hypothetical protein n=1 Tax=Streptomyces sp. H27-H1 TaxID=2996461 RepID=UPI00226DF62C|nr:hypothetical protein [Streptomyces sp. H27-H1]MCY0926253.1 hypothetical protein [Streptomyces sp. H27-H1]
MAKARLTDYTGAEIRPGVLISYATRQGNLVRLSEAVVLELKSDKSSGVVVPMVKVRPTGRDSGFIARKTRAVQTVSANRLVVIGEPSEGEK